MNPFPELNIEHLKIITQRWVSKYKRRKIDFSKIVLYRYASDFDFDGPAIVKYAIVFEMAYYTPIPPPGCDASIKEHTNYDDFLSLDLNYNSCEKSGLPENMSYGDFGMVYNPPLRDGFEKEWIFIPLYNGHWGLPMQVRVNEDFVVLYDETGIELKQTPKSNDPHARSFKSNHEDTNRNTFVKDSNHIRSFVLRTQGWDITFDGNSIFLIDSKPIRYLLVALKNPKKVIPYSTIVDIVVGSNQTHKTNREYSEMAKDKEKERLGKEGLTEKSNSEMDCLYTESEAKNAFEILEDMFLKLKDGTQAEKDGIENAIRIFERDYWYRVIRTKDSIRMGPKLNFSKRVKNDSSLIRNSIKGLMKKLEKKPLHRHLKLYLHFKNGVEYDPPKDQPHWEIKDT